MSPAYLVLGKEPFLKKEFVGKLREAFFPGGQGADLDAQDFQFPDASLSEVLDFLRTRSFFGSKRLAVVRDAQEIDREAMPALQAYLEKPNPVSVLVLISEESTPKKSIFPEAVLKKCQVQAFYAPRDSEWARWLTSRVALGKKRFGPQAADCVLERVGKEPALLASALEQLCVYVEPKNTIDRKDVEALLGRSSGADAFLLVDAVLGRDVRAAARILGQAFQEGQNAVGLLAALGREMERLSRALVLKKQGRSADEIRSALGIHPFYFEKFNEALTRARETQVEAALRSILECDEALKSSAACEARVLEQLVLKLASGSLN